jgi:ATP-dependent DNA helicase RecQ
VPPYVIFHDATLAEMVRRRPQSPDELGTLSGIGERKLVSFGHRFLDVIAAAAREGG